MIIVEHIKDGDDHLDGNGASVGVFSSLFPNESIELFCGKSHFDKIVSLLKQNDLNIENIEHHLIKPFDNFLRDYKLILFDLKIAIKVFNYAKTHNENKIVFLYTTTFLLYYIKILCFLNPSISVIGYLHGDLERIKFHDYAKSFPPKRYIFQLLYAIIFGNRVPLSIPTPKNLKYLVYGQSIKNNVIKELPSLENKIIAIPHPYFYKKDVQDTISNDKNIKFGIIGLSSPRKNLFHTKQLIKQLSSIENRNFSFAFAGKILDEKFIESLKEYDFIEKEYLSSKLIPSEIRDNIINNLDYALYTYKLDSYKLTASGALIDAINYEKPVIAITNDYVKQYFDKYGNIGYLCNSYEEIEEKVIALINNFPKEEYEQQVQNIKKIKENESIENIVRQIKPEVFNNV